MEVLSSTSSPCLLRILLYQLPASLFVKHLSRLYKNPEVLQTVYVKKKKKKKKRNKKAIEEMFSSMFLLCSSRSQSSFRMKKAHCSSKRREMNMTKEFDLQHPANLKSRFLLDDQFESEVQYIHNSSVDRHVEGKGKRRNKDSSSCFMQRAASSCLLHPLFSRLRSSGRRSTTDWSSEDEEIEDEERRKETDLLGVVINELFDDVWSIRKAYLNLQDATVADTAIAEELRRLVTLRWRLRGAATAKGVNVVRQATVDVKMDVLRKKLAAALLSGYGKQCRSSSKKTVRCYDYGNVAASPAPELFKTTVMQVREASQSFGSFLLSLMRHAHWDISASVHSITAAGATSPTTLIHRAKYALESYVSRKLFQGFNHQTFHMVNDTNLTFNADHHRFQCFTQYLEMKSVDPMELLAASPNCSFGKFCAIKYVSVVHPKMEESFFGSLKQHMQVRSGEHPNTALYKEFLRLAKAVWLLHLLAFSLDPGPSPFEASQGDPFCPKYMESVVGGLLLASHNVVQFPIGPGFKLGDGSIIKARVYSVS